MNISKLRSVVGVLLLTLCLVGPAYGRTGDELNKALDLVHQALNPGGDQPADADRTKWVQQALELAKESPEHHTHGLRVKAILEMKAALDELGKGDPDKKAKSYLRDAYDDLRSATAIVD